MKSELKKTEILRMSEDDLILSLDRLTRFKTPEIKYRRVFFDIISKFTHPSISKHRCEELCAKEISAIVEEIWNSSVEVCFGKSEEKKLSPGIFDEFCFSIADDYTKTLMNVNLDILPILHSEKARNFSENLRFCAEFTDGKKDIFKLREEKSLHFPISRLILTEGITEEILLPAFGELFGKDFNKRGIYLIAAGGKTKVLSLYAEFKYILKIPMTILLDNDAKPIYDDIIAVLRTEDNSFLLSGEFEDVLPKELIKRTFNDMYYDIEPVTDEELASGEKMTLILDEIHKTRGLPEFRKAKFAAAVKNHIESGSNLSEELCRFFESFD